MKSKIIYSILWWVVIFVEVTIIGFIPALATMNNGNIDLNTTGYAIHFIFVLIVSFLFSRTYFRQKLGGWKQGLLLAVWIMIIGILLDSIVTVPLFVKNYGLYFSDPMLWVGIGISFIGFILGSIPTSKKIMQQPIIVEETEVIVSDDDSNEL